MPEVQPNVSNEAKGIADSYSNATLILKEILNLHTRHKLPEYYITDIAHDAAKLYCYNPQRILLILRECGTETFFPDDNEFAKSAMIYQMKQNDPKTLLYAIEVVPDRHAHGNASTVSAPIPLEDAIIWVNSANFRNSHV